MTQTKRAVRVLVVDDETALADNLHDILEAKGYSVETATDGAQALALCQSNDFDIALLDIRLPDMTGLDLAQRLADTSADTECILITGYASFETALEAVRQKRVVGYEFKPLDTNRLLLLMSQIAERRRAEEALRKAHEELERKVEERTLELTEANTKLVPTQA